MPKTADSANITAYVSKDYGSVTVLGDTSATEMDATNAKGYYLFDLTQGETNADTLLFSAKSSTTNIVVIGVPATVFTLPTTGILAPATSGRTLVVDASGLADANMVKAGPTGSGVAQTGVDIGNAVTTIGVTSAALNKVPDSRTLTTGTGEANTYASTAAADGTYHSISDSAGSIDFYYEATLPTTGGALTGVNWLGYIVGVVNTVKVYIYNWTSSGWDQVGSVVGIAGTVAMDLDFDATNDHTGTGGNALKVRFRFSATGLTSCTVKTDRLLFGYTVVPTFPTNFSTLSIDASGRIDLGKWIGTAPLALSSQQVQAIVPNTQKVDVDTIKTNAVVNAGTITFPTGATLASTTNITAGTITTTTNLTNLPSIPANWITAAGITAAALNGKGDWATINPTNLTAGQIATGVWQDTTAGDFTTALSIGKSIMNGVSLGTGLTINAYTGNTVQTGDSFARIGATGSSLTSLAQASLWTSTRAGYVDNLSAGAVALASTALSTVQWTAARAGYLDNINNASLATISTSAIGTQITSDHGSGSYQTATGFAVAGSAMTLTAGERNSVADALLTRDVSSVEATSSDHCLCYVVLASSEVLISGSTMTVYRTNGTTTYTTKTVSKTSGDTPVRGIA